SLRWLRLGPDADARDDLGSDCTPGRGDGGTVSTHALSAEQQRALDDAMLKYLSRKSCTPYYSIGAHFELHDYEMLQASLDRLLEKGLVRYDESRDGYCTCAASPRVGEEGSEKR